MKTTPKETSNLGGIAKVWAIPSYLVEIKNQPQEPETYHLPDGFEESAVEITPIYQSGRFTQESKSAAGGIYYDSAISLTLAKSCPSREETISFLHLNQCALILKDQNRVFRLIGSSDYPVHVSHSSVTGAELSSLNHIRLEFSLNSPYPALFITNPF